MNKHLCLFPADLIVLMMRRRRRRRRREAGDAHTCVCVRAEREWLYCHASQRHVPSQITLRNNTKQNSNNFSEGGRRCHGNSVK